MTFSSFNMAVLEQIDLFLCIFSNQIAWKPIRTNSCDKQRCLSVSLLVPEQVNFLLLLLLPRRFALSPFPTTQTYNGFSWKYSQIVFLFVYHIRLQISSSLRFSRTFPSSTPGPPLSISSFSPGSFLLISRKILCDFSPPS